MDHKNGKTQTHPGSTRPKREFGRITENPERRNQSSVWSRGSMSFRVNKFNKKSNAEDRHETFAIFVTNHKELRLKSKHH